MGYGSEYDEWRLMNEIVELSEESGSDEENSASSGIFQLPKFNRFCLFEELACRIKSLLSSNRKGDPNCRSIMSFDTVSFDSLIIRSSMLPRNEQAHVHCKRNVYTVSNLSKFDDLLGERWYIRGLNTAGDFCYIIHNTVRFYLKHTKGKVDYQLLNDGSLVKRYYGKGYQLVFSFIRGDGISSTWNDILRTSQK